MNITWESKKDLIHYVGGFILIAVILIAVSWVVALNEDAIKIFIAGHKTGGALVYIALGIIATIVAPVSSLPFLPFVSVSYGWVLAGVFSIISWSIGSFISFWIARQYGKTIVRRFVSLERIQKLEARVPKERVFWTVVFLRIIIPVDALSYALGLFSTIKTGEYMFATVIGITPFAFVWAYFGSMPIWWIIGVFTVMLVVYIIVRKWIRF